MSDDCGKNYNYKIFEKGGENLSTYDEITTDFIPEENNQWREEIIDLTDFLDEEIMLKFVTTNLRGNNIFIDNINVYDENTTVLFEDQLDVTVHPNPSNGLFELSFNNHYIKTIYVSNILGQLAMKPEYLEKNINNYMLDLKEMKSGLYFLTIETKNKTKVLKILKND